MEPRHLNLFTLRNNFPYIEVEFWSYYYVLCFNFIYLWANFLYFCHHSLSDSFDYILIVLKDSYIFCISSKREERILWFFPTFSSPFSYNILITFSKAKLNKLIENSDTSRCTRNQYLGSFLNVFINLTNLPGILRVDPSKQFLPSKLWTALKFTIKAIESSSTPNSFRFHIFLKW